MLVVNENDLIGNGVILVDLILYEGCVVIYICLDQIFINLCFLNLNYEWNLDDDLVLCLNVYYCENEIEIYNGDDSDYEECDVGYGEILCEEDEEVELFEDDDDVEVVMFIMFDDDDDDDDEEFEEDDVVQFVGFDFLVFLENISDVDLDILDGIVNISFIDQ